MPTRVIDLRDPKAQGRIRLKISKGLHDRYLALSYSWGLGLRHNVKLKKETLVPYQDYIPEHLMTRSHQEALRITRELGYRYLWIDALCIIQGDAKDWEEEALKIAQVYSNAELTIVAGRSDDSTKGFLQLIDEPSLQPQAIRFHRPKLQGVDFQDFGECFLALNRSTHSGPVDERAWCFQGSVLSRRMIVYGMQQLSFKCRHISWYEDGSYTRYKWSKGGRYDLSSPLASRRFSQEEILARWYQLTEEYSSRDVYLPTDNFAALAGVASRFHDALRCRYLAGLWEADMERALLWRSRQLYLGPRSRQPLERPVAVNGPREGQCIDRAPSWSWLALRGPVLQVKPLKTREQVRGSGTSISLKCRPVATNYGRWSPDDWTPAIVEYAHLCRVQVHGYIREVRCADAHVRDLKNKPNWQYSFARLKEHAVLFTAPADTDTPTIVAIGMFDLAGRERERLWCLCISEEEGLLLEKCGDNLQRIGVFLVEAVAWFREVEAKDVTIV
jgi:hypothetical protein